MIGKSLCKRKSVKKPNKCKKVKGCKVATGKKRSFCRKKHNKTHKKKMNNTNKGMKPSLRNDKIDINNSYI